ncbi:RING finger protein 157 [Babesia bigemina]|uniref:RING finger protein 157 n=1 Tax=Babesia bigemina TaxID=5866 RepID=A0A061D750_BABBI|nr:RING finger protein 157 [Babesia bigemina]CDR94744.1 RING finger protein 157 [Babesia bigemina]|eukprot:XP_012766930.1 RING finger protein 157 [Babesia bigemina]
MGHAVSRVRHARLFARPELEEGSNPAPPQQIILEPEISNLTSFIVDAAATPKDFTEKPDLPVSRSSLEGIRSMGAAVAVLKSSITVHQFTLSFEYSSRAPATVSFLFQQKHQGLSNGIPSFSKAELRLGPYQLPVGDKLQYRLDRNDVLAHRRLTYEFSSFKDEPAFVPILLLFAAPANDYELFIMGGLAFSSTSNRWEFVTTKQRVRQGGVGYELQEVYGLNASAFSKSFNKADDVDTDSRCVVCLTNAKDTFVMPCRHMCMCSTCAAGMGNMYKSCPMCRTTISHIVHMSQMTTE